MTGKAGKISLIIFLLISAASVYYVTQLKFAFDFEQFFPQGDPELEFFRDFVEEFEADDNFLIVAVHDKEDVFQQEFLEKFHQLTLAARGLESVIQTQSLTTFTYPLKTPFASRCAYCSRQSLRYNWRQQTNWWRIYKIW